MAFSHVFSPKFSKYRIVFHQKAFVRHRLCRRYSVIHALVDAMGLPIALKRIEGQVHDGRSAEGVFGTVQTGDILLADRFYDSDTLHERLVARGAWGNIRAMPHRVNPPAFSGWLYRQRNAAERFFNKLKYFRAVAMRYDNYLASVKLAPMRIWLRSNESVT